MTNPDITLPSLVMSMLPKCSDMVGKRDTTLSAKLKSHQKSSTFFSINDNKLTPKANNSSVKNSTYYQIGSTAKSMRFSFKSFESLENISIPDKPIITTTPLKPNNSIQNIQKLKYCVKQPAINKINKVAYLQNSDVQYQQSHLDNKSKNISISLADIKTPTKKRPIKVRLVGYSSDADLLKSDSNNIENKEQINNDNRSSNGCSKFNPKIEFGVRSLSTSNFNDTVYCTKRQLLVDKNNDRKHHARKVSLLSKCGENIESWTCKKVCLANL